MKNDKFQKRYLEHQQHKKRQLTSQYGLTPNESDINMKNHYTKILKSRRSQRLYNSEPVTKEELDYILTCLTSSPSSCNRQAISIKVVEERDEKELLTGMLVGGVGWCHRANKILLLFTNDEAYKEKLDYMPFLDAGVIIFNTYLACESINLGCCFINPNIRKENKSFFKKRFSNKIFCGAIAIGHYDKKSEPTPKIKTQDILL